MAISMSVHIQSTGRPPPHTLKSPKMTSTPTAVAARCSQSRFSVRPPVG